MQSSAYVSIAAAFALAGCAVGEPPAVAAADPEDATIPAGLAPPITARGQEPGWIVEIGPDETRMALQYGDETLAAPTPAPRASAAGALYRYQDADIAVMLTSEICRDSMSGMPYPASAELVRSGETLSGCAGEAASLLKGRTWVVEDIDGRGVVDNTRTTIAFQDDGVVTGRAACNAFGATWALTGEGVTIDKIRATRKACPIAIMDQENRFFDILADVARFDIDDTGALVLMTADGRTITSLGE